MDVRQMAREMKLDAPAMASASLEKRNLALEAAAAALEAHKAEIFQANEKDMKAAEEAGVAQQVRKRLLFNEKKLEDVIAGIRQMIALEDPVGRVTLDRELDSDLRLTRITVPIGVIGVIFEARPDALVQISSLCLKSGNCAILKGGRETANTNRILYEVIHTSVTAAGMPESCLKLVEQHSEIDELLSCDEYVDLLIPRGSNKFVRYIMEHTRIPVMGHAEGVCHIYVDEAADQEMALSVIADAKTQYPVACNAVETILVSDKISGQFLPKLKAALDAVNVKIHGDSEIASVIECEAVDGGDYHKEYGDLELTVKVVSGVEEAVKHINRFGSHHTDCILTASDETAAYFMRMVDSAGVYRNCSTRFADGFRYGFGAEVGISTGKLHARGPVGLDGLVTYKYCLTGAGQIVGDYASGRSEFHFRDHIS